jgi:hypothetical protein
VRTHLRLREVLGGPGVTEDDLKAKNARFVNPKFFAEKVAAADKVVSP